MAKTEWLETPLSSLMDVRHGFAFPGDHIRDYVIGDILLTPGNFSIGGGFKGEKFKYFDGDAPDEYILTEGDLIVTMTDLSKQADTLGYPAIVPKSHGRRFLHNQRLGKVIIKPNAAINKRFLYYLLCTAEYRNEVLASATGTTVRHTSPGRILAHKHRIPSLQEQEEIASFLGALDDKIGLNRQISACLNDMVRALFQSLFVDFDPVFRKENRNVDQKIGEIIWDCFPRSFADSPIGQIPMGWEVAHVDAVAALNESTLSVRDVIGHIDYVEISEVMRGNIGNIPRYARGEEPSRARRRIRHGDTVISTVRPDRGAYFLAYHPGESLIVSTGFCVVTPKTVPWSWLYIALTGEDMLRHLGRMADGGAYPAIRPDIIGQRQIVVPPIRILQLWDELVTPWLAAIEENKKQSIALGKIRDLLLPRLMSGELSASQCKLTERA